ncbi:hypothetical protein N0V84_012439 [Fusarium piperis]|uniref:Uncharacterized protein n=1 Tax=Fusarium piperis TaxID=1435070 RepID=A0A9W8TA71_9HYPO|nr:hypothetical protein N0V84_012439 [Fusarium piperis]
MEPFTEEEKRLLLAEIIKNSQLDVKILGRFIKSNRIEPNWMQMQLPAGRSMAQCMRAVDGLDIKPRGRKRKVTYKEEPDSQSSREAPSSSSQELPPLPRPSVPSKHVPILPRPSSTGSLESPLSQPTEPLPKKKRGRPVYAGREVAGYQPIIPRPIAPKPSEEPRREHPRYLQPANGPAPRTILPKVHREVAHQGAIPPSSQAPRAQQPGVGPVATSYYSPISTNPRPAVARRNARRQLLGLEDGLQGPMIQRLAEPSPLRPRSLSGVPRATTEDASPSFRLQPRGDDRTATRKSRLSRASSERPSSK